MHVLPFSLGLGKTASGQLWNSRHFLVKEGINLDFCWCLEDFFSVPLFSDHLMWEEDKGKERMIGSSESESELSSELSFTWVEEVTLIFCCVVFSFCFHNSSTPHNFPADWTFSRKLLFSSKGVMAWTSL